MAKHVLVVKNAPPPKVEIKKVPQVDPTKSITGMLAMVPKEPEQYIRRPSEGHVCSSCQRRASDIGPQVLWVAGTTKMVCLKCALNG